MYISVYDWGEAMCLQEMTPSLYEFAKEQDPTNARKICWWVAPKFVFVYSESKIEIPFNK
jgi:hypothetical protein